MSKNNQNDARLRATQRVDKLRGFYTHVTAYVFVSLVLLIVWLIRDHIDNGFFRSIANDTVLLFIWIGWGVGLLVHIVAIFILPLILGENWKERKIRQVMEEEEEIKF
ncbi:2TM domain-containing protein [Flavobacteriaceae sp. LMIT009]